MLTAVSLPQARADAKRKAEAGKAQAKQGPNEEMGGAKPQHPQTSKGARERRQAGDQADDEAGDEGGGWGRGLFQALLGLGVIGGAAWAATTIRARRRAPVLPFARAKAH